MITVVNSLTILRILLAPLILMFLIFESYFICIFLFFIGGLTDYLDGYLARRFNAESQIGEILDPIADKIIIVFLLIGLAVKLDSFLIATLGSLIISREICVAALRDYASRNNLSEKTKVTFIAKVKTATQLFTIGLYLVALAFQFNLLIVITDIFLIITSLITLYTGYEYAHNVFYK